MEKMSFEMESRACNEQFARVVVAVFLSRLDPPVEELDVVMTAVSEAVTNCVIHGYEEGEGIIRVEVSIDGRTAAVRGNRSRRGDSGCEKSHGADVYLPPG